MNNFDNGCCYRNSDGTGSGHSGECLNPMSQIAKEEKVVCQHCGNEAEWVENKEVYNGRNYGKSWMIWLCRPCDAFVGCHNNTKEPLGKNLAKADLRKARREAHAVIDPLWKSGKYQRWQVYKNLSDAFGYQVHVGNTKTPEECQEIIKTAKLLFKL